MKKSGFSSAWTAKKLIALILLVLSFLMLFLPWVSISLNVMGQKFTIPKVVDYLSMYNGYSASEFKTELFRELVDLSDDMGREGMRMDPRQAMSAIELISDSKISPLDAARVCSYVSKLLGEAKTYLARNSQDLYGEERLIASMLTDAAGNVVYAAILMWVLVIGAVLTFALALFFLIKDKKYGVIPYLCVSLVLLIVFAVMSLKVNDGIKQLISIFSYGASSFFSELGINYSPSMDLSIFHLGIAGILSCIFAAGALVLTLLSDGSASRVKVPAFTIPKKWTCPSCGSEMAATSQFCTSCGTKRPEPLRCASCGRILGKDTAFCPYCGAPAAGRVTPSREAAKRCPSCGQAVPADSAVCPSCHYNFAGSSKLWGTLVKPGDDDLG